MLLVKSRWKWKTCRWLARQSFSSFIGVEYGGGRIQIFLQILWEAEQPRSLPCISLGLVCCSEFQMYLPNLNRLIRPYILSKCLIHCSVVFIHSCDGVWQSHGHVQWWGWHQYSAKAEFLWELLVQSRHLVPDSKSYVQSQSYSCTP